MTSRILLTMQITAPKVSTEHGNPPVVDPIAGRRGKHAVLQKQQQRRHDRQQRHHGADGQQLAGDVVPLVDAAREIERQRLGAKIGAHQQAAAEGQQDHHDHVLAFDEADVAVVLACFAVGAEAELLEQLFAHVGRQRQLRDGVDDAPERHEPQGAQSQAAASKPCCATPAPAPRARWQCKPSTAIAAGLASRDNGPDRCPWSTTPGGTFVTR